ncbi:MAG: mannose-1-phosphate guanylyltransferase [Erythrobacter sp. SCN 62-14]|nr:MAG: mannose-1-phosphate guanylyltransferase [Erythrobacter sp. SCN 62-14]
MQTITPVILCGGGGTRLWPLSRRSRPKPFLPLIGEESLFQQTLARMSGDPAFAAPMIVAGRDHCALIAEQIGDSSDWQLVIEPAAQNTAPAIALAASLLPPEAIMLVCPSDLYIADPAAFRAAAKAAAGMAREDYLVAFGIAPDRPETGYGYIERGEPVGEGFRIARFIEKPDLAKAQEYLASGAFCWNGGIFAFRAGHLLAELAAHRPEIARLVAESVAAGRWEGHLFRPASGPFAAINAESIDYAVMENTRTAAMVGVDMGWSDIGNWRAFGDALQGLGDDAGNIAHACRADFDECNGVLAVSDGPRISAVGLRDLCIVVHDGEVLVTTREGAQRVGKLPGAANQT